MSIRKITKRDGNLVDFNRDKITAAIYSAAQRVAEEEGRVPDRSIAERMCDKIVARLEVSFGEEGDGFYPTVEQTQDLVEKVLIKEGYSDTAKEYILYRERHKELREEEGFEAELGHYVRRLVHGYVGDDEWETRENANSGSVVFQGLNAHIAGRVLKNYALNQMYAKRNPKIKELHEKGKMHIHDLSYPNIAYCAGWSLEELLRRGFGEVPDRVQSSPPKHLETAVNQMVNFIGTMQGEFAGAQAFSAVDTRLAPFVRVDDLDYEQVKQRIQALIYGLNVPSRWGWQAPFSNLSFDLTVPEDLKDKKVIVGGEELDTTYGDYQKEMDMINRSFLEIMLEGDKNDRMFTFPIPTYSLIKDFDWDSDIANLLFKVTGRYGIPYFQNYIGTDLDPSSIRAMCCRLNIDQTELMTRPGGLWGPGDSTGSIGVVTVNMNRIGYEASNEEEFFEQLGTVMDAARDSLEIKREIVNEGLDHDFVPYTKSYLGHFMNHFSTIGLCGMHEACLNFLGEGIGSERGEKLAVDVLDFMRDRIKGYQEETGNLYNLEATPAESTAYRFAMLDKKTYPNIITSGEDRPFLTNSTHLNVDATRDLFSAIEHQDAIQPLYTGGTIFHTFLPEEIDGDSCKRLVRKIAENTSLPYFNITPTFSVCRDHGYLKGQQETCPRCGDETEIYSRIVGYLRPVSNWNDGKKEEFRTRTPYLVK